MALLNTTGHLRLPETLLHAGSRAMGDGWHPGWGTASKGDCPGEAYGDDGDDGRRRARSTVRPKP